MTTELSAMLAFIAVAAIAIALFGVWWINRAPRVDHDASEALPLFTGLGPSARTEEPPSPGGRVPSGPAARTVPAAASTPITPPRANTEPATASRPTIVEFNTIPVAPPQAPAGAHSPSATRVAHAPVLSDTGVPGTMIEGHAIRFSVPAEGTMQFLPGRLEVGSGIDEGREIRFVHVPGPNGTEVTFGRTEGALYRHIQLRDLTVSRQHAVLHWRGGRWYLRNLSQTNPVARNGQVLDSVEEACLEDGDRLDMGEVRFTFRSR